MCLILFSWQQNPAHPLVLIANRDELYQRPTQPLHHWPTPAGMVAGKDSEAGGTWLAAHHSGRFAALTNVRNQQPAPTRAPSRGELIPDFLASNLSIEAWSDQLRERAGQYSGFNLLFGDITSSQLFCYNNQSAKLAELSAGLYGLSNAELDDPWPKVTRGKQLLSTQLSKQLTPTPSELWPVLSDELQPESSLLPDTGIGLSTERLLAPITIRSERYGTCSSTVIISHGVDMVSIDEQQRRPNEKPAVISLTLPLIKR